MIDLNPEIGTPEADMLALLTLIVQHYEAQNFSIPKFDIVTEFILYIAGKTKNPTTSRVGRMIFLADRIHLGNYGRLMYNESYQIKSGEILPTRALSKMASVIRTNSSESFSMIGMLVIPVREPDLNVFSESEMECMDQAIGEYDHLSTHELMSMTFAMPIQVSTLDIAHSLPDNNELIDYLEDPHP